MMWWKIALGIGGAGVALFAYALCVVAGRADEAMERIAGLIKEEDDE